MKYVHNERVYTLILTVFTILLFSILAISLLTITISGAKKSAVREDVTQATELAEKGLTLVKQQIVHERQMKIDQYEDGVTKTKFNEELENVLEKYDCATGTVQHVDTETGSYEICMQEHIDKGRNTLPQQAKFEIFGQADTKQKKLISVIEFDGNAQDDDMEYAVNTFITQECTKSKADCALGEGNLFLHGGVGIQGDINVEGNLITSNRSHEKYVSDHWIHSYFPSSIPKQDKTPSRIIVGKDVYTVTWPDSGTVPSSNQINYATHVANITIPNRPPYEKKKAKDGKVIDENV